MKYLLFLIILVDCYITNYKIVVKKDMINCVSNFMYLNEVLMKNDYSNLMRIKKYDNSIYFNYKTYSIVEDYKYEYKYLIKNKNTYIIKYTFKIFNEDYDFLFYIKAFNKSSKKTSWNIILKYNQLFINDKIKNDKFIYKYLNRCLYKTNDNIIHPYILNIFKK